MHKTMSTHEHDTTTQPETIRWGVLGAGGIAAEFCTDLQYLPDHQVVAVGARSSGTNTAFADRFNIAHRHSSYAELVADPDVDVVYVATPHPQHFDATKLAIEAGKHVLVEKPFTMNAADSRLLADAARTRGTFLMEAMWTWFLPHIVQIRELVHSGRIGEIVTVTAEFGEQFGNDSPRAFVLEQGGGALLDIGIYPVSFAAMLLGQPSDIIAAADLSDGGVDVTTSIILRHSGGAHAVLNTTMLAGTRNGACITGTLGRIEIEPEFFRPSSFEIVDTATGIRERVDVPHVGGGLRHQADEVGRCLRAGLTESPILPLAQTISIMETMDEVARQIGLHYPPRL
jgi:predicted dehydrogenase